MTVAETLKQTSLQVMDSFRNLMAGLAGLKDKSTYNEFTFNPPTVDQLEAAYRTDWYARKIVDIPAIDMTRPWRSWQAKDDQIELIEEEERRLGVQTKTCDWIKKSRLYGGSLMILGMKDQLHDQPLDYERVKKGDLVWLHVVSRHDIQPGPISADVYSPWFGLPEKYTISGAEQARDVHASRVIRYIGNPVPNDRTAQEQGWGDSILTAAWPAVVNIASVSANISALINESKIDVIKVKGLLDMVGNPEYVQKTKDRWALGMTAKSTINALLIDSTEEWQRIVANFSGLEGLLKTFALLGSAAADIPATRLLGQSAVGLNSTGEGDSRNYYDRLTGEQNTEISPAISPLDEVLIRSATNQRDPAIHYVWNPLWLPSGVEKADTSLKKAQVFTADMGNITDPVFLLAIERARMNQLVEDQVYPGLEGEIEAAEKERALLEAEQQAAEERAAEQQRAQNAAAGEEGSNVVPMKKKAAVTDMQRNRHQQIMDAKPRTLYVRRDLINVETVRKHYAAQGLTVQDGLHVTIAYSSTPVDWTKTGDANGWTGGDSEGRLQVSPGGARLHERLGKTEPGEAVTLLFTSSSLTWRWREICEAGASWDFEDYQPHMTLAWDPDQKIDAEKLVPYRGELVFGPEVFEEIDENWKSRKGS